MLPKSAYIKSINSLLTQENTFALNDHTTPCLLHINAKDFETFDKSFEQIGSYKKIIFDPE